MTFQEPELPKVDILVPKAKTLVERKKATGMDDQEFFFEERWTNEGNEGRETWRGKLATGLKNGCFLQKDFSVQLWGIQFVDVG